MEQGRLNTEAVAEMLRHLLETVHASQNAIVEAAAQVADPGGARLLSSLATGRVRLEGELRELLARVQTGDYRLRPPRANLQQLIGALSHALHFGRTSQVLGAAARLEVHVAEQYEHTAASIAGNAADLLRRHAAAVRSNSERLLWRIHESGDAGPTAADSSLRGNRVVDRDAQ